MSAAVDRVVDRLQGLKPNGTGWTARCPAHEDTVNSLSITEGTDGRVLMFCHAGCRLTAILDTMGLKLTDLYNDGGAKVRGQLPLAVFQYRNREGIVMYEARRYPPKDFRLFRPDPGRPGAWLPNMVGVSRIPYRLNELANQPTVVIVEGEKDADRLWSLGIPATCNTGGALKWKQGETSELRAMGCQRVIICRDNDEAGHEHGERVAVLCKQAGMSISMVDLPGLGPGGDVSDWLDAGHTVEELRAQLEKPYVVGGAPAPVPDVEPTGFNAGMYKQTDLGNAEAFVARYGDVMRFDWNAQPDGWLVWGGHTWRRHAMAEVRCFAHQHVRQWQVEVVTQITDYNKRTDLLRYLERQERSGSFDALMKETRVKPEIRVTGGWDEHPWLVGTSTGIVDLRTCGFRDGKPTDMVTRTVGVEYQPSASADRWVAFLHQIFGDDEDVVAYVQRAIGYCLTGVTTEQCFFMAHGVGANGKSTFLSTLDYVFGQYAHTTDIRTFMHVGDGVPFQLAELAGKRLVTTSEAKTRSTLNEQVLKNVTGGDRIEAQRKHGHPFSFMPTGKIWFAVNHQPRVGDESHGFWRRVRLVPFTQTFRGSDADPKLVEKLKAEGPGILQWAIEGCRLWQQHGLQPPSAVVQATEAYRASEDHVNEFIQSQCVTGDAVYRVKAGALYKAYVTWAKDNGIDPKDGTEFGSYIKSSFPFDRVATGVLYRGIGLRSNTMPDED